MMKSITENKEIVILRRPKTAIYRVGRVNLYTFVSKNSIRVVKISAPHRVSREVNLNFYDFLHFLMAESYQNQKFIAYKIAKCHLLNFNILQN